MRKRKRGRAVTVVIQRDGTTKTRNFRIPIWALRLGTWTGAIAAVLGMLALNGLPMPYHPVFNVPRFAFATKDRFFLMVFSTDPKFNTVETRRFLEALGPRSISEVPS